jgi:DNA recombination protein RmuC
MDQLPVISLAVIAGVLLAAVIALALAWRRALEAVETDRSADVEARLAEVSRAQSEITGRIQAMGELFDSRQAQLAKGMRDGLDGIGHRVNQSIGDTTRTTQESLAKLAERLAVIDRAQSNITDLSSRVVQLQHVLSDKQTRGAFGQGRMETIVSDGLPAGRFQFQHTLSNGKRPDCVIFLPNDAPILVIDAKFPLEAWNAIRAADTAELKAAQTRFRNDIRHHIKAIRERYLIAGETHDTAFLFVPSESIFAEIHENFDDIVQESYRNRVRIVSPTLLLLSVEVVQAILKDVQMREQADRIRDEVVKMMEDVRRLDDRVRALKGHFDQSARDIDQILVSTGKVIKGGEKIGAIETQSAPAPAPRQLRLDAAE